MASGVMTPNFEGGPTLEDSIVNQTPDINTGGVDFIDGLEMTALDGIDALTVGIATRVARQQPPAPRVGTGVAPSQPTGVLGGGGLVLVILLVLIFWN
jgi:hypothetical protein